MVEVAVPGVAAYLANGVPQCFGRRVHRVAGGLVKAAQQLPGGCVGDPPLAGEDAPGSAEQQSPDEANDLVARSLLTDAGFTAAQHDELRAGPSAKQISRVQRRTAGQFEVGGESVRCRQVPVTG